MRRRWRSWTCRPGRGRCSCAAAVTPTTCRAAISSTRAAAAIAAAAALSAFDLARLETRGTPVPVIPDGGDDSTGGVDAVVAGDGTLAYVSEAVAGGDAAHARVGRPPGAGDADPGAAARVSSILGCHPMARASRVYANDQEQDIWVWDLRARRSPALTFDVALITIRYGRPTAAG